MVGKPAPTHTNAHGNSLRMSNVTDVTDHSSRSRFSFLHYRSSYWYSRITPLSVQLRCLFRSSKSPSQPLGTTIQTGS